MVSRQKIIVSNCPKSGYEGLLDLFQNGFFCAWGESNSEVSQHTWKPEWCIWRRWSVQDLDVGSSQGGSQLVADLQCVLAGIRPLGELNVQSGLPAGGGDVDMLVRCHHHVVNWPLDQGLGRTLKLMRLKLQFKSVLISWCYLYPGAFCWRDDPKTIFLQLGDLHRFRKYRKFSFVACIFLMK